MTEEIEDPYCLPNSPVIIKCDDIKTARELIKDHVVYTNCVTSHFNDLVDMEVYLKQEFMQYTGSFKERGARHALMRLSPEEQQRGVIACSAGNHAQALAYHGKLLNMPVTVVMPKTAPIMKVQKCIKYGANVIIEGENLSEAKRFAMKKGKDDGLLFVNGYDHPHILEGQGSIALEILEQLPDVDAILVPCGGGGMLAGIGTAIKELKPCCEVIGVESEAVPGMSKAFEVGAPVTVDIKPTLADGLSVALVGYNAFASSINTVSRMVAVGEHLIALAMLRLLELEKAVVEGSGATTVAALFTGKLDYLKGKKVVCILSGGNVDTTVLARTIERGLAEEGRLIKADVFIKDAAGHISKLLDLVGNIGVNVKHIIQERSWIFDDVHSVKVRLISETRNYDHALELRKLIEDNYKAEFPDFPTPPHGYKKEGKKSCKCSGRQKK